MGKKMGFLFAVFVATVLFWGVVGSSASFAASPIDITAAACPPRASYFRSKGRGVGLAAGLEVRRRDMQLSGIPFATMPMRSLV